MNVLKTAKVSAYTIALIAGVMSYGHQSTLLLDSHAGLYSYAVPLTVDVLAFISAMVRNSDQVDATTRKAAVVTLVLAGSMSIAANVAVGENLVQRIVGVWTVAAYLLAEWFVARLKPAPAPVVVVVEVEAEGEGEGEGEIDDEVRVRRSEAAKRGAATRKANREAQRKADRLAAREARRASASADIAAIEALLAPTHSVAEVAAV